MLEKTGKLPNAATVKVSKSETPIPKKKKKRKPSSEEESEYSD